MSVLQLCFTLKILAQILLFTAGNRHLHTCIFFTPIYLHMWMRTSAAYADLLKRHSAGSPHYIVICNLLNVEGELAKGHDILTKNASLIFLLVRVCTVQCTVPSLSVTSTLFSHFAFTFYSLVIWCSLHYHLFSTQHKRVFMMLSLCIGTRGHTVGRNRN